MFALVVTPAGEAVTDHLAASARARQGKNLFAMLMGVGAGADLGAESVHTTAAVDAVGTQGTQAILKEGRCDWV